MPNNIKQFVNQQNQELKRAIKESDDAVYSLYKLFYCDKNEMQKRLNEIKVLIVNDVIFILESQKQIIQKLQIFNIDTAENGQEAFEMI